MQTEIFFRDSKRRSFRNSLNYDHSKKKSHRFDVIRRRTTENNQRENYDHDVSVKLKHLKIKIRKIKQQKVSKSQS